MEAQIITVFCIIDDILKCTGFRDDLQVKMTTSEAMTTVITAGMFFAGNHERARNFLSEYQFIKNMLSKSQFNRRWHQIDESLWETVNFYLAQVFIQRNESMEYVTDSFPVKVCHNMRINRCKIYQSEEYRGWSASKREYFYGIKVHAIVTTAGEPIEWLFSPGSLHDNRAFKSFQLDLPAHSSIYADAAFTDYAYEYVVQEAGIDLQVARKSNSKRQREPYVSYLINHFRKSVETTLVK